LTTSSFDLLTLFLRLYGEFMWHIAIIISIVAHDFLSFLVFTYRFLFNDHLLYFCHVSLDSSCEPDYFGEFHISFLWNLCICHRGVEKLVVCDFHSLFLPISTFRGGFVPLIFLFWVTSVWGSSCGVVIGCLLSGIHRWFSSDGFSLFLS